MTTPAPASTPWVPMWSLQGGVNQAYLGAWAAGTYQPGQIVVDNGVEYLCVRQTTKRPTAWPASGVAGYGTTLPSSPLDGQEFVLVDSITAPSYQWRLRYNASSSSAYKWEFVGGSPWIVRTDMTETTTSTTAVDLATVGPQLTLPRDGDYLIQYQAQMTNSIVSSNLLWIALNGTTAGVDGNMGVIALSIPLANNYFVGGQQGRFNAVTGARTVKMQYSVGGGTGTFLRRTLMVTPIRVA